ncbi:MAG: aspartate carbamoyltransferase [Rhodoferax sp.]|nr:aspartate carbamoyltransferase [Rhodoferax sp.]
MKMMEQAQRQAVVAERGKDVMPFNLAATTHIFTKTAEGGTQQVVAKKTTDAAQVNLARGHLREIREQFSKGDFSGPSHIHGQDMPGLAELREAKLGQIAIDYKDVKGGGQLTYKTADATLVAALHKWFDAQLSDHGKDAMEGHAHHGEMMKP